MTPEEWPIAASASERSAPARMAGSERLAAVRADFLLDPSQRLTEQERALMTAMLNSLVGDIADELRSQLPAALAAANDDAFSDRIDTLRSCGLLDDAGLLVLLLRRGAEERIGTAASVRTGRREARTVQALVSHAEGAASAAAMALILGRARRRDRFGQCLVSLEDLPADSAERLVHAVAALLRCEIAAAHDVPLADGALCAAAARILAALDAQRSLDALTASLACALDEFGALDDELIVAAAHEGDVAFVAHSVARRAGIDSAAAFDELLSGRAERLMGVLRAAGVARQSSAALLAGVGDLLGIEDAPRALRIFDEMTDEDVNAARQWFAAPATYRAAVKAVGKRGQRPV